MPLGIREERTFRRAFTRYLRILREMNFEDSEDVASTLAAMEILVTAKKAKVRA